MNNYNKYLWAYQTATSAKIEVYGLSYNLNWDELMMRCMTIDALEMDDLLGVLTTDEKADLESKMREPYNI
jgi:hypothetical protein